MSDRERIFIDKPFFEELTPKILEAAAIRTEALKTQVWHLLSDAGAKLYKESYSKAELSEAREALKEAKFEMEEVAQEIYEDDLNNLLEWCLIDEEGTLSPLKDWESLEEEERELMRRYLIDKDQAKRIARNWLMSPEERQAYGISHQMEFVAIQGLILDKLDEIVIQYGRREKFLEWLISGEETLAFHLEKGSKPTNLKRSLRDNKAQVFTSFGEFISEKKLVEKIAETLYLDCEVLEKGAGLQDYKEIAKEQKFRGSADEKKRQALHHCSTKRFEELSEIENSYFTGLGRVCLVKKRGIFPLDIMIEVYEALRKKEKLPTQYDENRNFLIASKNQLIKKRRQKATVEVGLDEELSPELRSEA